MSFGFQAPLDQKEKMNDTLSRQTLCGLFYHNRQSHVFSSSLTSVTDDKSPLLSPHPSLGYLLGFDCSLYPAWCLPNSDMQISEQKRMLFCNKPQTTTQSPLVNFQYVSPGDLSADLQIVNSSSSFASSSIKPASLVSGLENLKTKTKNSQSPKLPVISCDSGDATRFTFSMVPASASSLYPCTNLDYSFPSHIEMPCLLDFQSEKNQPTAGSKIIQAVSHENSGSANGGLGSVLPSSTTSITYYSISNCHYPSHLVSFQQNKSLLQSPQSIIRESPLESLGNCLCHIPTMYKSELGTTSDMTKQSVSPQCILCHHNDITDSEKNNNPQIDIKKEGEDVKQVDITQTTETIVYNSKTNSLSEVSTVIFKEKEKPQVLTSSLKKSSTKNKLQELRKMRLTNGNINLKRDLVQNPQDLHNVQHLPRPNHIQNKVGTMDLTDISSCDLVTQTSLDASEGKSGYISAVFEQAEGLVYWAEPIQVSSYSPLHDESSGCEAPDKCAHYLLPQGPSSQDLFHSSVSISLPLVSPTTMSAKQFLENTSTVFSNAPTSVILTPLKFPSTVPNLTFSSCSLSTQTTSSFTSHITHRRDIPYTTNSKCTVVSSVFTLDTSTPFRAVQSWTELQIQRNTLTKKLSHGALHYTDPNNMRIFRGATQSTQRTTLTHKRFPWRNELPASVSVVNGLRPDDWVNRKGNEDDVKICKGNQTTVMAGDCICGHQCTFSTQESCRKQQCVGNISVSKSKIKTLYPLVLPKYKIIYTFHKH